MNRKIVKLTLLACSIFFFISLKSQTTFLHTYSHVENGVGGAIFELEDGNFILAGHATGESGVANPMLMKIDESGAQVWTQIYDMPVDARAYDVISLPDNGFMLCGYKTIDEEKRIFIMTSDQNGDLVYSVAFDYGIAYSITKTSDNKFAIIGKRKEIIDEYHHYCFIIVDENLNILTNKIHYFHEVSGGRSIEATADNGFISAGFAEYSQFGQNFEYLSLSVKFDATGDIEWFKEDYSNNIAYDVSAIDTDGYYFTGYMLGWSNYISFFSKRDISGEVLWDKHGFDGISRSIAVDDDNIAIVGYAGITDLYWVALTITDKNGGNLSQKYYCTGDNCYAYCIEKCEDEGYIICGKSGTEILVLKTNYDGNILSINENKYNKQTFNLSPNPAADILKFDLTGPNLVSDAMIIIYNSSGIIVKRILVNRNDKNISCNVSDLSNGLYFAVLQIKNEIISTRKFLINMNK